MDGDADDRWNTMWDGHVLDDDADGWRWGDVMAARDQGWTRVITIVGTCDDSDN
jgi:hypothetical protein